MLPPEQYHQRDPTPVLLGHVSAQDHGLSVWAPDIEARTRCDGNSVDRDVGKVAVDNGHDGLQVDETRFPSSDRIARNGVGFDTASFAHIDKNIVTCAEPRTKRRSRKWLLLAAIVGLVIVMTAAVVGGVLGSRKADGSNSSSAHNGQSLPSSTSSSTSPTETSTVSPSSLKRRSNLSVAGWRKSQGLQIFLYYQSQNGSVRWSTYDDTQSSFTYNGSYWGDSKEVGMDSTDSAAEDTSLAAGIILWDTTFEPQIELFYLNSNYELRGANNMNNAAQYQADSVNNATLTAATSSSLTGYWPYFAYISQSDTVSVVGNVPYSENQLSPTSNWTVTSLAKPVMPGSRLVIVPLVSDMTDLLGAGGYGVFYQDPNGTLVYTQPNREAAEANGTLVDSWPTDAEFPLIRLAAGGSFAAFTTARSDSSQGRVNTYVPYQEISSRISMVYLNNDSNWEISQPEAMSNADNGTDIACLTMPISQKDDNGKELELEEASSHANRCYFQRDGYLREFALSGTDWIELGTIPMN